MGAVHTEEYECLELFVKSGEGDHGAVWIQEEGKETITYPAGQHHYRLLRIPLKKDTVYDVTLKNAEVSIAYLSETEDLLDRGVLFLEYREGVWEKTRDLEKWYRTPNREQYHFCPYKNWINDPNGLCWYKGYYHMYYQANPHEQEWGLMHWGHAASKDCVHWVHLPYVLMPQEELLEAADRKGGAFSGSAVALEDRILFYLTRHEGPQEDSEEETVQYQTMVESTDGIHFGEEVRIIDKPEERFSFNFRDPKVSWMEGKWQMVIAAKIAEVPSLVRYTSMDGYEWAYEGVLLEERTEGVYTFECPDFFPLGGKMVAAGSWMFYSDEQRRFQPTYYYIGEYKDGRLEAETKCLCDFGSNYYALQTFEHEGRRIGIGWVSDFYLEHCPEEDGAYGSMGIPRELFLKDGKVYQRPIREIYQLKGRCFADISGQNIKMKHLNHNSYYAKLQFKTLSDFEILLGRSDNGELRLIHRENVIQILTTGVRSHYVKFVTEVAELQELEIFMDRRMVEVYVNGGEQAGTKLFYQEEDGIFEAEFAQEDAVERIELYEMKGIWR